MSHLTMEQLLATREPGLEPRVHAWKEHASTCPTCRAELERLDQRVARLKALPVLKPARDRFDAVRLGTDIARRRRRRARVGIGGLALAASVALAAVALRSRPDDRELIAVSELQEIISQSQQLERALATIDPDRGVLDGRTISISTSLEQRLAGVDRQLQLVNLLEASVRRREALRLWRERVGLLDALMDVRLTRARYVGF